MAVGVSSYTVSAEHYDLLYSQIKDYEAETARLLEVLSVACPSARAVLDVGCGTGRHAQLLTAAGLSVDGLDLEPAFVRIAQARNPGGTYRIGDMTSFQVSTPYDVVLSLFGTIGYARDRAGLEATMRCLAAAVRVGGVVVVEPWLSPSEVVHGRVTVQSAATADLAVSRVSRVLVEGGVSVLEFEYLIGRADGIEHIAERHALGLFTESVMIRAFEDAGLRVTRQPGGLIGRGLYVATRQEPPVPAAGVPLPTEPGEPPGV
jgi:SAM-dependent methyltransferase